MLPNLVNLKDIFLLPNLLSVLRIVLVPFFLYFLATEKDIPYISVFILTLMILSDYFDGFFSRKLNQVTSLGKLLDPIADKVALAGGFLGLVLFKEFPLWFLLTLVIRDIGIVLGGAWLYRYKKEVVMANMWGKVTTTSLAILAFFYLFQFNKYGTEIGVNVNDIGLYICLFLFATSTLIYLKDLIKKLR